MSDSIGYYGEGGQAGGSRPTCRTSTTGARSGVPPTSTSSTTSSASFVYRAAVRPQEEVRLQLESRSVDGVLGGWQMGGIFTAHTGFPLTIKMSGDPSGTGARSVRANVIGTPNDPHQIGPGLLFLDLDALLRPGGPHLRQRRRRDRARPGHEPHRSVAAASSSASPRSGTSNSAAEAFNLTNTPIFSSPASQTITSTTFGQIRSSQGERNIELAAKFYF